MYSYVCAIMVCYIHINSVESGYILGSVTSSPAPLASLPSWSQEQLTVFARGPEGSESGPSGNTEGLLLPRKGEMTGSPLQGEKAKQHMQWGFSCLFLRAHWGPHYVFPSKYKTPTSAFPETAIIAGRQDACVRQLEKKRVHPSSTT